MRDIVDANRGKTFPCERDYEAWNVSNRWAAITGARSNRIRGLEEDAEPSGRTRTAGIARVGSSAQGACGAHVAACKLTESVRLIGAARGTAIARVGTGQRERPDAGKEPHNETGVRTSWDLRRSTTRHSCASRDRGRSSGSGRTRRADRVATSVRPSPGAANAASQGDRSSGSRTSGSQRSRIASSCLRYRLQMDQFCPGGCPRLRVLGKLTIAKHSRDHAAGVSEAPTGPRMVHACNYIAEDGGQTRLGLALRGPDRRSKSASLHRSARCESETIGKVRTTV